MPRISEASAEKKRDCVSDCLIEFPRLGGFSAQRIAPGKFYATPPGSPSVAAV